MSHDESPPPLAANTHRANLSSQASMSLVPSSSDLGTPAPPSESNRSADGEEDMVSQGDESSASSGSYSSGASASTTSQQYLHAAFQLPPATNSQQQSPQQPTTPAATNNGRQRATSLMAPKEMPQRLTKNYKELARDFRLLKPFTRVPDGTYPLGTRCVLCEIGAPQTVFFPCQHKCVCGICIKLHDISADRSRSSAWSSCPVCMTEIRLMLPYSGKEEEEYWKWISEVKPSLPSTFKLEFKDAAKKLKKGAVLPDSSAPGDAPPMLKNQPSSRRHTWHSPGAPGAAGRSGGGGVDPKTCTIL